jgi:hypothetical protein
MLAYPAKYGTDEKVFRRCYRDPYITHTTRENCSEKEGETDNAVPNGSVYEKILVYACCYYGSRAKKKIYKFCARFPAAKFAEHRTVIAGVTGTLRWLTRFIIQLVIMLLRDEQGLCCCTNQERCIMNSFWQRRFTYIFGVFSSGLNKA